MRNLDNYIDAAKGRLHIQHDAELGRKLGFAANAVNHWRTRRAWPKPHHMIRLAELAGIDAEEALLELGFWSAKEPIVKDHYLKMMNRLIKTAAAILLFLGISNTTSSANTTSTMQPMKPDSVYYGRNGNQKSI